MQILIDGEWVDAADGSVDEIRDKATGELIETAPRGSAQDVVRAVEAAQRGRRAIAAMPSYRRAEVIQLAADAVQAEHAALSHLLARENGKTLREVRAEIDAAIRIFRGYAEEAKRVFGRATPLDSVPGQAGSLAVTLRQPRGVIAAIIPFNYPVELWAHKIAAGLAAGNAVITKPPEECPLTIARIAGYFEAAGLPRGSHQVITGLGEIVGAALVRSPGVHMVSMTGSTESGRQILRDAADSLKKVHLELGGNDATIVCEDADVQETARALVAGRFTSGNGQICCAVKRVLVDRKVYEPLLAVLLERTRALRVGNPIDEATDVGPLISEQAAKKVEAQVERAVAEGATVAAGGRRRGAFFEPTVLTGLSADSPALQEEVFGPVLPIVPFDDFEQALADANLGPYGLQAALFTRDLNRVMHAFRMLDVGTVVTNHSTAIRLENLPFGGTKLSGNAREGLHETLLDMTEQKTLLMSGVFPA